MRPSFLILGAVSYVAAQNCNPTYNVASSGDCMKKCSEDTGKSIFNDYTTDPASPNFIKSVGISCSKGTPDYIAFMTKAGTCWLSCPKEQQDAYTQKEFKESCTWYNQHKDDKCDGTTSSSNSSTSASGSAPASASNSTASQSTSASTQIQVTGVVGLLALGATILLM